MLQAIAILVLATAVPPAPPDSGPTPVTLRWAATEACPDAATVLRAMALRDIVEPVTAEVRVQRDGAAFVADVAIASAHGQTQRTLRSPSCETIVEAVALLVQVAADPLPTPARIAGSPPAIALPPAPAELPELVASPPVVEPRVAAAELERRPPARRRALRFTAALSGIVGGGLLPGVDAGGRLGVGIAATRVHIDAGALAYAPRTIRAPADATATFDAFGGFARVCPTIPLPTGRVALSACAIASAGVIRGRSRGDALVAAADDATPWVRLAVGPELGVVVHPRVRLVAGVEVGGHVARAPFQIRGERGGDVWAPRPWAAHGTAGIEVRLP